MVCTAGFTVVRAILLRGKEPGKTRSYSVVSEQWPSLARPLGNIPGLCLWIVPTLVLRRGAWTRPEGCGHLLPWDLAAKNLWQPSIGSQLSLSCDFRSLSHLMMSPSISRSRNGGTCPNGRRSYTRTWWGATTSLWFPWVRRGLHSLGLPWHKLEVHLEPFGIVNSSTTSSWEQGKLNVREHKRLEKNGACIFKYISALQIRTAHDIVLEKPLGQGEKADSDLRGLSPDIIFPMGPICIF